MTHVIHAHQLRVPAGYEQRDEGKLGRIVREQWREQMAFQVVHADDGFVQHKADGVCIRRADQQRACQSGAGGAGNRVHIVQRASGIVQHFFGQWHDATNMVARGQFGYHAAVGNVHVDLRMQGVREQAALIVVQRHAGFVAGGFDAQYQHDGISVKALF